jgi:hypothetical protein
MLQIVVYLSYRTNNPAVTKCDDLAWWRAPLVALALGDLGVKFLVALLLLVPLLAVTSIRLLPPQVFDESATERTHSFGR